MAFLSGIRPRTKAACQQQAPFFSCRQLSRSNWYGNENRFPRIRKTSANWRSRLFSRFAVGENSREKNKRRENPSAREASLFNEPETIDKKPAGKADRKEDWVALPLKIFLFLPRRRLITHSFFQGKCNLLYAPCQVESSSHIPLITSSR